MRCGGRDTDVEPRTVGAHIRRLQSITALDELDFLRTVRDAGDALTPSLGISPPIPCDFSGGKDAASAGSTRLWGTQLPATLRTGETDRC
jgi:hypothetical protein